jgi:hypothetical protein
VPPEDEVSLLYLLYRSLDGMPRRSERHKNRRRLAAVRPLDSPIFPQVFGVRPERSWLGQDPVDPERAGGGYLGELARDLSASSRLLIPGEVARESGMMSPTNPI